MAGKENKSAVNAPASPGAGGLVTVEVLHPIDYEDAQYGRGLHELDPDVAEFFLRLRVPNRVTGPQPVARLPLPSEPLKRGVKRDLDMKGND